MSYVEENCPTQETVMSESNGIDIETFLDCKNFQKQNIVIILSN